MRVDIWTFETTERLPDIAGFEVEAIDGHIGKIDDATMDAGSGYVVISTGPWIFGKKVVLPAGVIDRIDAGEKRVYVDRTKDQIKGAPEYDEHEGPTDDYRGRLGSYYGHGGEGFGGSGLR
jgi:PRC-barrel domain